MSKKIYVGNLPYTTNDQSLTDAFSQCGTVESAKVIMDKETGKSRGFGFVELQDEEKADYFLIGFVVVAFAISLFLIFAPRKPL